MKTSVCSGCGEEFTWTGSRVRKYCKIDCYLDNGIRKHQRVPRSVLNTEKEISELKRMRDVRGLTFRRISDLLGVHQSIVYRRYQEIKEAK